MARPPSAAAACARRRYCRRRRHPRRLRRCSCKLSSAASAARWKAIACSSPLLARIVMRTPGGWSSRAATWASRRRGCARLSCSTAWSKRVSLRSAPALLLRLLRARLAALGGVHSREEASPLGVQSLPRVLELAASKAADSTAFDHAGSTMVRRSCLGPWPVRPGRRCPERRAGRVSTKSEPARRPVPNCIAHRVAHPRRRARAWPGARRARAPCSL